MNILVNNLLDMLKISLIPINVTKSGGFHIPEKCTESEQHHQRDPISLVLSNSVLSTVYNTSLPSYKSHNVRATYSSIVHHDKVKLGVSHPTRIH